MTGALRGGLAALALGVAVGGAVAEQPSSWLPTWLGGKPAIKPMEKPDTTPDKQDVRKRNLDTSINTYLRRQQVYFKLKQVAEDTGNTALAEEADRLDKLAWELHQQRSGGMVGMVATAPDEPKIDKDLDETRDMLIESASKKGAKPESGSLGRGGIGR